MARIIEHKLTINECFRRLLLVWLLCVFAGINALNAATFSIPGTNITLSYTVAGGEVTISDCNTDADGSVIIPSSIVGMPVVGIKVNAFYACKYIDSVDIPASVSSIGVAPFENCFELVSINVAANNPSYASENGVLFNKNKELLIEYPHGQAGAYSIPTSVKEIEYFAFSDSDLLTQVTFPSSLEIIGRYAFSSCNLLDNVQIPGTVDTIRESAFASCNSLSDLVLGHGIRVIEKGALGGGGLTEITVPGSVQSLGRNVFSSSSELTSVTLLSGVTEIPDYAFSYCRKLTQITIPSTVTRIGVYAFRDCELLASIMLPEGLQIIDIGAFDSCDSLVSVLVPSTVTQLQSASGFGQCLSLQEINVSSANATYSSHNGILFNKSQSTLIRCPRTKSGTYSIPSGVTSLSQGSFAGCKDLTAITVPYGVTEISDSLFSQCESLASIDIPNSVTRIGHWSFYGCIELQTISIAASVVDIYGASSFQGCTGIVSFSVSSGNPNYTSEDGVLFNKNQTELIMCPAEKAGDYTIPATVSTIDYYYSFRYCDELQSIFVHPSNASYQSIGGVVFNEGETELLIFPKGRSGTYVVPSGVVTLGIHSFSLSQELTSVVIPEGVTTIERQVFYGCRGLEEVVIPRSVSTIGPQAFDGCSNLVLIYMGNAPSGLSIAAGAYYFEGATGFPEPSPYWWRPSYIMLSALYSDWIDDAFIAGTWSLHERLPNRDADGDGVVNLLEYAFMTDPTMTGQLRSLEASVTENVEGAIQLGFVLREDATDVTYVLKASDYLGYFWETVATYTPNGTNLGIHRSVNLDSNYEIIGDGDLRSVDDGVGLFEMREALATGPGSAFFRIEVVQ